MSSIDCYSGEEIQALRELNGLSQAALASLLNASYSTVQKWERGTRHPNGPSLKLLSLLEHKGLEILL